MVLLGGFLRHVFLDNALNVLLTLGCFAVRTEVAFGVRHELVKVAKELLIWTRLDGSVVIQ